MSTTASISVVNARQELPPAFQPLYEALNALERDAAVYINLSQLKLALRGLETENAMTRVAGKAPHLQFCFGPINSFQYLQMAVSMALAGS